MIKIEKIETDLTVEDILEKYSEILFEKIGLPFMRGELSTVMLIADVESLIKLDLKNIGIDTIQGIAINVIKITDAFIERLYLSIKLANEKV
jgi:hypothetical protein